MEWGCSRKQKEWDSRSCNECSDDDNVERNKDGHCNYGFVSYFGEAVWQIKTMDGRACITKEVRKEIGLQFKSLPQ
ncbi:hypothetical protein CICLE_v10033242mg [Citrus x clementina]|uniref:Uncharacterized protein n=1 Tax=Citrus clementina TaxID=85681 RepID=V4TGZ9_CITCL|nr:hypothetical protein CICLE_v10033242mg [Citrus x clementina]